MCPPFSLHPRLLLPKLAVQSSLPLMASASAASASGVNWCGEFKDSQALRETLGAPSKGFASCAVVGSSGILALERLGPRIDSAELVIRFNLNSVYGFEPIVGKRTSLRSINSETIGFLLSEHRKDIHEGGGNLRRFRNASWCPDYPVFLNSFQDLYLNTFRAVCSGTTTIIDGSVFDEHDSVLESLGPKDANLMSGQLGVALATMLCPNGVDVYGFTHDGSLQISRKRDLAYHYFDPDAQPGGVDSLDESAHLLSRFAAASAARFHKCPRWPVPFPALLLTAEPLPEAQEQPNCVRLWTPSEDALTTPFKPNGSRRGADDALIDTIRSESEPGVTEVRLCRPPRARGPFARPQQAHPLALTGGPSIQGGLQRQGCHLRGWPGDEGPRRLPPDAGGAHCGRSPARGVRRGHRRLVLREKENVGQERARSVGAPREHRE